MSPNSWLPRFADASKDAGGKFLLVLRHQVQATAFNPHIQRLQMDAFLKRPASRVHSSSAEEEDRKDHRILLPVLHLVRKCIQLIIDIHYASALIHVATRRPHVHVHNHVMTGANIADGEIAQHVHRERLVLRIAGTDKVNQQCQALGDVVLAKVIDNRLLLLHLPVHHNQHRTSC